MPADPDADRHVLGPDPGRVQPRQHDRQGLADRRPPRRVVHHDRHRSARPDLVLQPRRIDRGFQRRLQGRRVIGHRAGQVGRDDLDGRLGQRAGRRPSQVQRPVRAPGDRDRRRAGSKPRTAAPPCGPWDEAGSIEVVGMKTRLLPR